MRNRSLQRGRTLPKVAMDVVMWARGATSGSAAYVTLDVLALEYALKTWEPPTWNISLRFNRAVCELVEAAIFEFVARYAKDAEVAGWRDKDRSAQAFNCHVCGHAQAIRACRECGKPACPNCACCDLQQYGPFIWGGHVQ